MNKIRLSLSIVFITSAGFGQLIAKVVPKKPIEGVCDNNNIYELYGGFKGQIQPKCAFSKTQIQELLNEKITFVKENPKFKGKGLVKLYVNCKGEPIDWELIVKTKNDQLDREIFAVLKTTLNTWTAGTLDGKPVDAGASISYKIKKGVITVE
jgi:hypothetical protein